MRIDAQRHRQQLIEAAASVFVRDGADAPLQAVLTETGFGRGTLYRHFEDREALVLAVLEHEVDNAFRFVKEKTDDPAMFREFLRRQSLMAAVHSPGLGSMSLAAQAKLVPLKRRMDRLTKAVVAQARAFGQVRPGFDTRQLTLVVHMLMGAAGFSPTSREQAIEEALEVLIEGLRPQPAPAPKTRR